MSNNRVDIVDVEPVWHGNETGMQFTVTGFSRAQAESFDREFCDSFHGRLEHEEIAPDHLQSRYVMPRSEARMFMGVLGNFTENLHLPSNSKQFKQQYKQQLRESGSGERGV